MNTTSRPFAGLLVAVLAATGCNFNDEKPRGHGASGRKLDVLPQANVGMERFYKYGPEHETVLNLLDRSFEQVAQPGPNASHQKARDTASKVRANWNKFKLVHRNEGRFVRLRATIATTVGDLVIDCFEGATPEVARNFIVRLDAGLYDGQPISVEGDALTFGPPVDKQAYTLPPRTHPYPLPRGAVFAFLTNGRATGERFGISLKNVPGGSANVSLFGRINQPGMEEVLGRLVEAHRKKPGSVVVKSVRIDTFENAIFEGSNPRLPTLTKDGRLSIPDIQMYTQVMSDDLHPREMPLAPQSPDWMKGDPGLDRKDAPQGPTIPEKKSEQPPLKKEPSKSP